MTDKQKDKSVRRNYQPEDLSTADGISRELRKVYTDYRRGTIDGTMAGKATYILRELNQVQTVRELQERLVCMEEGRTYIPPEQRLPDKQPATIEGAATEVTTEASH